MQKPKGVNNVEGTERSRFWMPPPGTGAPLSTEEAYPIELSDTERLLVHRTIEDDKASAYQVRSAHILLQADAGPVGPKRRDVDIAKELNLAVSTVHRLRKRAATEGIEAALQERRRGTVAPKLDGEAETRLIALARSDPPPGRTRWTLHLLAQRFSELEGVPVSHELVRRTLRKRAFWLG